LIEVLIVADTIAGYTPSYTRTLADRVNVPKRRIVVNALI
jgi:hypothetical protein